MNTLEKVERLRERADVTYEEAKAVLEEANGDLLDAMVLLERRGKVKKPEQSTYSTDYEEQDGYVRVRDKVEEQRQSAPHLGRILSAALRKVIQVLKRDFFSVSWKGQQLFMMPAWVFALILLLFWKYTLIIMIVSLFFGVRYQFSGEDDLTKANDIMNIAGDIADDVRNEFRK